MKKTIAILTLALAGSNVYADDSAYSPLYRQVTANVQNLAQHEVRGATEFSYAPLHVQVAAKAAGFVDEMGELVAGFSYSPLYLQVTGQSGA